MPTLAPLSEPRSERTACQCLLAELSTNILAFIEDQAYVCGVDNKRYAYGKMKAEVERIMKSMYDFSGYCPTCRDNESPDE